MSEITNNDLLRRERAWFRQYILLWTVGTLVGSGIGCWVIIAALRRFTFWTMPTAILFSTFVAVALSVPLGLLIARQRRRQSTEIFEPRAASLQIDNLQRRIGGLLLFMVGNDLVCFGVLEGLLCGMSGPRFIGGSPNLYFWIGLLAMCQCLVRSARTIARENFAPVVLAHPHGMIAMQDEGIQAARKTALLKSYPILAGIAATVFAVSEARPHLTHYLLPVILLAASSLPTAVLAVSLIWSRPNLSEPD
jgi:hypothetical protein